MNILILGANGFIGSHLCDAILEKTDWTIDAIDLRQDKLSNCIQHARFKFYLGDMTKEKEWIKSKIKHADAVLPLVAIATPATYVNDPIAVFALDFEANLEIIKLCVAEQKRVIFPSTSEVYGMCQDEAFDEESSLLITGPIHKERWIYAASKQLLDRLIYAYGKHEGLPYTLFRPFNWYGPRLDNASNKNPGASRVLTQFIGNVMRQENIYLVNGGEQKRCFTYIDDGIEALIRIIENKNNDAHQKIFNIGNPHENISIRNLAEKLKSVVHEYFPNYAAHAKSVNLIEVDAKDYYGQGYQDVKHRIPAIEKAKKYLNWLPKTNIDSGLKETLKFYLV